MIELPDFSPLKVTQRPNDPTAAALESFDHVIVVARAERAANALRKLPNARALERALERAKRTDAKIVTIHPSSSDPSVTLGLLAPRSAFDDLAFSRRVVAEALRERPRRVGVATAGLATTDADAALQNVVAAAEAAALELPTFKSDPRRSTRLRSLTLFAPGRHIEIAPTRAAALGNNVARWLTALPPNRLTPAAFRRAIDDLVAPYPIKSRFLGERQLERLGAGAFLAVAQGNATRDAGIMHLRYRPTVKQRARGIALVGKGVLFDTGGTNLKSFHGMLDMHIDMQGSAVALGTLLALAQLQAPFAVDAWLAITENRTSATAYKSQDVVRAANGTTIQVIHTDAEGRMVLADTLALAARERPHVIIDYATLTGSCKMALTDRYAGAFANRAAANDILMAAGSASGERVWPFPMDEDYDEALKSDVADVKQCAVDNDGDHILAARFLKRFVPDEIPWIHLDLAAGKHKGGLAHVPTDITGFGVRLSLELLLRQADGPEDLARKLAA